MMRIMAIEVDGMLRREAVPPPLAAPAGIRLVTLPEHPCPYLPGRTAQNRAFVARRLSPQRYHDLMDSGFRRSGELIYQPICGACRACVPIRVPTARFVPSKSQRRCWRRNDDIRVSVAPPHPSDEKFRVYQRYIHERHPGSEADDVEAFCSFVYESPVNTLEFAYRDAAGRLLGVGICDACPRSLSSVYFYFEQDESDRSLGTFGALWEIEYARRMGIGYYYLGFWVDGCRSMQYKAQFRPHELLRADGTWRQAEASAKSRDEGDF